MLDKGFDQDLHTLHCSFEMFEIRCSKVLWSFVGSNGWVNNLMRRNGFLLHRKATTAQQDPKRLIDSLFCIFCMLVAFN